jgi:hypothetical protein
MIGGARRTVENIRVRGVGSPPEVLRAPDVNWGGRFDGPETVRDAAPKPDVTLPTVETDAQIDNIMKQGADGIEARLDKLVAENPHWGRLR